MSGGSTRDTRGMAVSATKAALIGRAIQSSSAKARTRSTPKRRNTPATIAITIGMGMASIARRTHPLHPSTSIRTPVARNAPITSAKLEVRERRADEHGAGNAPEKHQRLPVAEREGDGDEAIEEKPAEDPGGDVRFGKAAARAGGEDDGDRPARGEQEGDDRIGGVERAEVGQHAPRRRQRQQGLLERHGPQRYQMGSSKFLMGSDQHYRQLRVAGNVDLTPLSRWGGGPRRCAGSSTACRAGRGARACPRTGRARIRRCRCRCRRGSSSCLPGRRTRGRRAEAPRA